MDTQLAKTIGSAARTARISLGISQADVAERAGISSEFYARIERGTTLPSAPTLVALSGALEVTTDALVGRSPRRAQTMRRAQEGRPEKESPELRRLVRRARRATPKVLRLLNLLAAALTDSRR